MSSLVDNESLFSLMQKAEECEQEVQAARHVAYVADEAYKKARLRADAAQLAVSVKVIEPAKARVWALLAP